MLRSNNDILDKTLAGLTDLYDEQGYITKHDVCRAMGVPTDKIKDCILYSKKNNGGNK
jgi:hypothetical protein